MERMVVLGVAGCRWRRGAAACNCFFERETSTGEERERAGGEGEKTARTYAREASTKNIHSTVF